MRAYPSHELFFSPRAINDKPLRSQAPRNELVELEFSEYMRDARFPAGWWILPGSIMGAGLIVLFATLG